MSTKNFLDALVEALPHDAFDEALKDAENKGIRQFYLPTWGDNVWGGMSVDFQKMFNEGEGNELLCKACAIHSSSMLAYNFFHWINGSKDPKAIFEFEEIKFDRVVFEVKIPCLWKSNKGKPIRAKHFAWEDFVCANMDIMLVGKKDNQCHVFFLESKFTEHFSSASDGMSRMKSAYSCKDRYIGDVHGMTDVVDKFRKKASDKGRSKAYYDGIKQSICHLIAMTNLVEVDWIKKEFIKRYEIIDESPKFHFANLLFKPDEEKFTKEARYYDEYCKLYEEFYKSIDKKYPAGLDVRREPLSYTTVWNKMKNTLGTINERLKEYLEERYMSVASK